MEHGVSILPSRAVRLNTSTGEWEAGICLNWNLELSDEEELSDEGATPSNDTSWLLQRDAG